MILAAGRGERMRPLSDSTPKPMLQVAGKPLLMHLVEALVRNGFNELVINHAWHGEQIERALGDGRNLGAKIAYSPEPSGALGTGGAIVNALPILGNGAFLAVSGDVWTDFPFVQLPRAPRGLAHLVMVDNPYFHPQGDFVLRDGLLSAPAPNRDSSTALTFAGIGVYRRELFDDWLVSSQARPRFPLAPILVAAMHSDAVSAEHYRGEWVNVGTPEQLGALDADVLARESRA